jgi:hypothetical protein
VQTACAPTDQPVHPSPLPTRAQPRTITSKPPTFTVEPWGTAPHRPRTDADRIHDRQAQERIQREAEFLEQQTRDEAA